MLARSEAGIKAALAADFPAIAIDQAKAAIKTVERGGSSFTMCQRSTEFLLQLSHEEQGKVAIREAKGIPVLARMLHCSDEKTVVNAVDALMGITIDPEGKVQTVQVRVQSGVCGHACLFRSSLSSRQQKNMMSMIARRWLGRG